MIHGESHCTQMEKTWNSGESSQELLVYQNYFKSTSTNHPGSHKRTQRTTLKNHRPCVSVKVGVRDSTIRKRLGINDGRIQGENHFWTKRTYRHVWHLPKTSSRLLGKYSWTDKTKVNFFGRFQSHDICNKTYSISEKKHHSNCKIWW